MQPKREAQMATSQAAKKSRTTAERKESTPTASEQKKLKRTSQVSQVRFTSAGLFAWLLGLLKFFNLGIWRRRQLWTSY